MKHFPIQHEGKDDHVVLISCAGDYDTGGGLCAWDGSRVEVIDRLSTAGIHVAGNQLWRCLRKFASTEGGEILIYDSLGVKRYLRADELSDVHFLVWHEGNLVLANTGRNEIVWLTPGGEVARRWRAPGENDSWHLNDICVKNGRLLACAFGRYRRSREYKERMLAGDGIIFDVETGRDLLTGLCMPHSPRFFDNAWAVCNSKLAEVLQMEEGSGVVIRKLKLDGFTRGLAVTDDLILVGESDNRHSSGGQMAAIAVISRRNWERLARISVPFREISDIILAPRELMEAAGTGFRTNSLRTTEQDQFWLFQQAGEPLLASGPLRSR